MSNDKKILDDLIILKQKYFDKIMDDATEEYNKGNSTKHDAMIKILAGKIATIEAWINTFGGNFVPGNEDK